MSEHTDVLGGEYLEIEKKTTAGGLPGYENLSPEDQAKKERQMFREVFSTPHGRIVLTQILLDLKYFSVCTNEQDTALSNYAKFLLQERLDINDTKKIVNALIGGDGTGE